MRLHVVTPATWLVEDFRSTGTETIQHYGYEAPDFEPGDALWCSGAFANRLLATGIHLPLTSPGIHALPHTPWAFLGRHVASCTVGTLRNDAAPDGSFIKLAEAKLPSLPAQTHARTIDFLELVEDAALRHGWSRDVTDGLALNVSEPTTWATEFRCFVAHGKVTAGSFYLGNVDGSPETWDAFTADSAPNPEMAMEFAQKVVNAHPALPAGFVIDVGITEGGVWSVIEYNAAWSSNPYHCHIPGVLKSVLASQQVSETQQWLWTPDQATGAFARPLPRS
jgi:hypothetical protein